MQPATTSRLAYSLGSRSSESSFPERHAEPDDITDLHHPDPSYEHLQHPHHQQHHDPGFPKLGLLTPGLSAFWQQSWLDQYQPSLHHDAPARPPRHQHGQNHRWVDDTACFSPASPHSVMRVSSPQAHVNHGVFSSSPLSPVAAGDTSHAEWESILRAASDVSPIDLPWLSTRAGSKVKSEDDSDSNWSVNDNSSDDTPIPQPQQPAPRPPPRRRPGSAPRVTKLSKLPAPGQGVYHTFRMSKRPPAPAASSAPDRLLDFNEATPFGPIASYDAANNAQSDPAKMLEKRIAHKLSEKSRRNRLTSAIREIQKLMPLDAEEERAAAAQKGDVPAVYPHFSKVDVVEMAIGYIKRLQRENEQMARQMERVETQSRTGSEESTGESHVSSN